MLPFIKEKSSLWEYLKQAEKPVVLYGTGDGADKIIARLAAEHISVAGIYASDEFVRGQRFHGFAVKKYSELLQAGPVIALICFASERAEVLAQFYRLARVQETYAPHVPVFDGDEAVTAQWLARYEQELQEVYDRLADDASRKVFASVLNYKISGRLSYLQDCTTNRNEDLATLFSFGGEETYVDAGAYNGDTIKEFLQLAGHRYKKIFAAEPDAKNFKKLAEFVDGRRLLRVTCLRAGVWEACGVLELDGNGGRQSTFYKSGMDRAGVEKELAAVAGNEKAGKPVSLSETGRKKRKAQAVDVVTIDAFLGDDHADYMKFDVEGVEKEALLGARKHLVPDGGGALPKLLVAAYHHDEDIFRLPLMLWQLQPQYKIYLRKHPYVPAWEINFFAK